jgi:hypothetical protein
MGLDIDGDGIVGCATSEAVERDGVELEAQEARALLPSDAAAIPILDAGEAEEESAPGLTGHYHHALLRLNTHENLIAWLKIRSYLRDVKGLRTLELLRTCTLVFLPPLAWCTVDLLIASLRNPSHTAARILSWRIDRTFDFFVIWLVIIRIFQIGTAISERLASHKNVVNGERMAVLYQQCALQDELVAKILADDEHAAAKAQVARNKMLDDLLKQTVDWLKSLASHPNEQPKVLGVTLSTKWAKRISALFVTYGMFLVGEVARKIDID